MTLHRTLLMQESSIVVGGGWEGRVWFRVTLVVSYFRRQLGKSSSSDVVPVGTQFGEFEVA